MFETEFLTSAATSKDAYRQLVQQAAEVVSSALPNGAYAGKDAAAIADLLGHDLLGHDPLGKDLLPAIGYSSEHVTATLHAVILNSVAISHPRAAAHLHCPPLLAALAAEVVISALNQSMDSFDQAPAATVVEQKLIRWLCTEAGLPPTADGTFTTGGTQSNYMGLLLARDAFIRKQWNWSVQEAGLPADTRRLRIFCSEVAHFTVEKSASQLGLGTDSVVRIAVDERFRMNPSELRASLEALRAQGLLPMAIVATAGTTDFGSIDPLPQVAALARSAGAWLHVDAAYGGALLFSGDHRDMLLGIEEASSLAIDFHKLFWQPIPCSAFLLRNKLHFDSMKLHADYLNPESHEGEGIPNLVKTSLLTSRRFDALKLWISFQMLGRMKFAAMIDRTIALASHSARVIKGAPRLELICEPQLSTVVFRYLPSRPDIDADQVNATLRQHLFNKGIAVIGHTRVRQRQYLKFTCMNPSASEEKMESLVGAVIAEGKEVETNWRDPSS